jgi:TonB family protein
MPKAWKEWEGRVVNKEFRLGEFLGGSERAGVFMTQYGLESLKAAVKLIPVGTWDQASVETELSRLQSARELSHPHLLQILEVGHANLDDSELLFVVMEYADENLAQILTERALTAAEVREMLTPTLEALDYLHGKGFVHGHLKPVNVMAIGDQLKLSSDGISASGSRRVAPEEASEYDAPEMVRAENSAASDVWSLGMLLVIALTQQLPGRGASGAEPVLRDIPAPFDEVASHCLLREPHARWGLAEVAARLGLRIPAATPGQARAARAGDSMAAELEVQPRAAAARAAGPQLAAPRRQAAPGPRKFPYQPRSNGGIYVAAAVVALIVGILVIPRLFRSGSLNSQASNSQTGNSQTEAKSTATARATGRANSKIAAVRDPGSGAAVSESKPRAGSDESGTLSATRGSAARRRLTAGQVAEQVLPNVPQSAMDTIRGTVRVGVRVSVDSLGNVTDAALDSPGPSKYFAKLALESAQEWKFDPPKMEGRNVLSDWLLQFQFTGTGTKVVPMQSDP